MNIISAFEDPNLLGRLFPDQTSWQPWKVCLKAIYGIQMTETEFEIFKRHTDREHPPTHQVSEAYLIDGRGSGKTRVAAGVIVPFHSVFMPYEPSPGERLHAFLLSVDRRQSRIANRYCSSTFHSIPYLNDLVDRETANELDLQNNVSIEIATSSFRTLRGYSICCAVLDEVAFFRDEESQNPDVEIVNALRPGLGRVAGSLLLCISSPYAKRGVLWNAHRDYYGVESDDLLVWNSDTLGMNCSFNSRVIDRAFDLDPSVAAAEYGKDGHVSFRSDLESFIDREIAESCVRGYREMAYLSNHSYSAFCDPSGGSQDSMTMAISHKEGELIKVDVVRERIPPFSPEEVVREFSETLKAYKIASVSGDKYAGEWPRERFSVHGIHYEPSEKSKSELYRELLPLLNSKRVELPDDKKLIGQLCSLERRTGSVGRDIIDHAPGGHDDVINAVAGSILLAAEEAQMPGIHFVVPSGSGHSEHDRGFNRSGLDPWFLGE